MSELSNVSSYVTEKISVDSIDISEYITTDNLLQNKRGRVIAEKLPTQKVTKFKQDDILIANIRPYLKKIWQADIDGGASSDVLVVRPNDVIDNNFLYYALTQDSFFEYVMKGSKGTKMPRGDKSQIMNFVIPDLEIDEQIKIGKLLKSIDQKIQINNQINQELEAMAKTLYDYWFVQFDFPDQNGKPYKSSGGKMVYNPELKREIPEGWGVDSLWNIANFYNGLAMQKYRPDTNEDDYLPVIKIREMMNGFSKDTEKARLDIPTEAVVERGDILFSWSATLEVIIWGKERGALNQHIFKVTSDTYPKSFIYFELKSYLKVFKAIAELRKTTMGHITQDHLKQAKIVVPPIELISKLDAKLQPIMLKQQILENQNQELTQLRDWLLPMLMNGQVKVENYTD
jgi:restriction modification system DNA specificity subunit